jgi:CHAD domain-containing protein
MTTETERTHMINGSALPGTVLAGTAEAVYFDTSTLRLARWGMSLRRWQGDGTGWQLTVASGPDTWRRIHRPHGTEPPEELVTLLAGVTRGAELAPVPRASTRARTRAAPEREAGAGEAVQRYLTDQVGMLMRQDVLVRAGADDAVHQLRVAARRIRGALRDYGTIVDRTRTGALSDELRRLTQRLGPARDHEVLEERIRGRLQVLPDQLVIGPVWTGLTRYFATVRKEADRIVRRTLTSRRYLELLDGLERLAGGAPLTGRAARPARTELPKRIRKAYRRAAKRLQEAQTGGTPHDAAVHRARKAAKRLRYALEVAEPVIGKKASRTLKRARKLTSTFGDVRDSVVARPVLRTLGAAAHVADANGFTFGLLYAYEEDAAERAETELDTRWQRLHKRASWLR